MINKWIGHQARMNLGFCKLGNKAMVHLNEEWNEKIT